MSSKLKEKYLLLQLRTSQNPEVYGKLYDIYVEQIYRFIYFKVSSKEEAEDLTAEVFLKTWQYIREMGADAIDNLQAFLYQTARNTVIDFYRTRGARLISQDERSETSDDQLKMDLADEKQDVLQKVQLASDVEEVKKALQNLKEEYREVVVLRFIEEMSVAETAEILGKSRGAVRVLLHRAIGELRGMVIK